MPKYKLMIAYDGTDFGGWQVQPNTNTVQAEIEKALAQILSKKINVIGSGRTDAGVHANGQVAHFILDHTIEPRALLRSLNALLPKSIRILSLSEAPDRFHAQISSKQKTYRYSVHTDPVMPPMERHYAHHVFSPVDFTLLKKACDLFTGKHDFTSFANQSHLGAASKNPVRTIYSIEIIDKPGGFYLEFKGNGFLYKMVRNLSSCILRVARGKLSLEQARKLLEAKDRTLAPAPAPAKGLFLLSVDY